MRILILSVCIALCASAAFGQVGGIGLYINPAYTDCEMHDITMGLVPVYAVHKFNPGATASQWMVITGGGFTCTHVGETVHMPTSIGSTLSGISLGYGGCHSGDLLLVTINWFCSGTSTPCAWLEAEGDPASGSGHVEVVDCAYVLHITVGGKMYVNPDDSCHCWNPTKETNWGRVKALYQ